MKHITREDVWVMPGEAEFEVYEDHVDEWRWRLRASNGEILASGQGFRQKEGCTRSVNLVKLYAPFAKVVYV